jgi:hypothetical protein
MRPSLDVRFVTLLATVVVVSCLTAVSEIREERDAPRAATGASKPSTIDGTIVEVDEVELRLRVEDERVVTLRMPSDGIDLAHLREHARFALPVRITLHPEHPDAAAAIRDLPPRTAKERARAHGLTDALDDETFEQLEVDMPVPEVARIAGAPRYFDLPGATPGELCWQWDRADGDRSRFYEACFDRASNRVTSLDPAAT